MSKNKKCLSCKKFKPESKSIKCNFGYFCCNDCRVNYGMKNSKKLLEKEIKKRHTKEKKQHQQSDIKLRKSAAQKVFNEFIRFRDKDDPCISCGKYHTGQYHAGHYKTVSARPDLRFNEDNCHKQCSICNNHLSANITEYTPALIKKIGEIRFDELLIEKQVKYTAQDYLEIERYYKEKLKNLK